MDIVGIGSSGYCLMEANGVGPFRNKVSGSRGEVGRPRPCTTRQIDRSFKERRRARISDSRREQSDSE